MDTLIYFSYVYIQKENFYDSIYRFIIGGTILSGATWLANYSNPLLAGILITIPLELVSLFLLWNTDCVRMHSVF